MICTIVERNVHIDEFISILANNVMLYITASDPKYKSTHISMFSSIVAECVHVHFYLNLRACSFDGSFSYFSFGVLPFYFIN